VTKSKQAIQRIYCPWCHAPLVFIGNMTLTFDAMSADEQDEARSGSV
jgi:RNase P subunit RPR2